MRSATVYHIGIDDTDSSDGMCTTFLVYNLVMRLLSEKHRIRLVDYPNLIRLNPNIPWKTRGNGALAIRLETNHQRQNLFDLCRRFVKKFSKSGEANSGLVMYEGEEIPNEIQDFSKRALSRVLSVREAERLIEKFGLLSFGLRSKQGIVGSLASIGNPLKNDFTFELIAYRKDTSKPRLIDKSRIAIMNSATKPMTFNSYDEEYDRVLISPHGPDPVLLGIRGETPRAVKQAFEMLLPIENLLGHMIFRSNQGTGEHLSEPLDVSSLKAFFAGSVRGFVSGKPRIEPGGHVFFPLRDPAGEILCACYEPAAKFRFDAMALAPEDEILVGGGIRKATSKHPRALNVEYFRPIRLTSERKFQNPMCPKCKRATNSMGRGQGFRCTICGNELRGAEKSSIVIPRRLREGEVYVPPLKAQRHLTKPLQRFELARKRWKGGFLRDWFALN